MRRDLTDARAEGIFDDWRFGIAYNAALKLCTILLCAEGYRPIQNFAHCRTLQALPLILGRDRKADTNYLGKITAENAAKPIFQGFGKSELF